MRKPAIFAISVRPHVRQFLLFEYGVAQPHAVHQNTFIGRAVRMKLEKQPFTARSRLRVLAGTSPCPRRSSTTRSRSRSTRQLGKMFDKLFQQQLIMWVKAQVAATGNERLALRTFCKNYDIDPSHADLETLRKIYRDYKDKVLRENGQLIYLAGGLAELFRDYAIAS